jgi:DNA-binding transcriptional regulator GbsR (MarR family)
MPRLSTSGWQLTYVVNRKDKDKKPYYKPTKDFKKIYRRLERAKSKDAMNKKKEILPRFRKSDIWNYT